jgi:glycosyltransferase involved in cell wall biosynthesis
MMKPRILMLVRELATGTERYTVEICSELRKQGCEILLYEQRSLSTLAINENVKKRLDGSAIFQAVRPLQSIVSLSGVMKNFRPNVIFAQGLDELGLTALLLSSVYKRPAVTFVHDMTLEELRLNKAGSRLLKLMYILALSRQKFVSRRMKLILVGSAFMQEYVQRRFGVVAKLTPLGVEEKFLKVNAEKHSSFTAIFVGNLIAKKMPHLPIIALSHLKDTNIELRIVGEGPLFQHLKTLSASLSVDNRVRFLGRLSREELVLELAKCHVCIVPSAWEGFGLVVLEAMAAGLPVIASNTSSLAEIVRDGYNGLLFQVGDAVSLAECLRKLYKEREKLSEMSENARVTARGYSWRKTAEITLREIAGLLA